MFPFRIVALLAYIAHFLALNTADPQNATPNNAFRG